MESEETAATNEARRIAFAGKEAMGEPDFYGQGTDNVQTFADGLGSEESKGKAEDGGADVAWAARVAMGINLYGAGSSVAMSWVNGLNSPSVMEAAGRRAAAVAAEAGLSWRGLSPPKEGPLKDIDKDGERVAMAWVEGFGGAIPYARSIAEELAGVASGALEGSAGGPTLNVAAGGGASGGPSGGGDINIYLTFTGEPPSDEKSIAEAVWRGAYAALGDRATL